MREQQIVSVSTLVALLQDLVEENFVEVLVQGELASLSRPSSGHVYFTLKDQKAQLRCAMFRSHVRALRFNLEDGMDVICRGRLSVYPQRGDLQLLVEGVEPVGVGSLQLAFEQLQQKLAAEGLFAPERKRKLPEFPQTIGIVSSATGAAIHDILTVLRRRAAGLKVLLRSVRVQGDGAASEICEGIADLNRDGRADILIVGRGGGSKEDLWAFNEEEVARAIADSDIPVISAVGHEVDISISDLVADLRAATPSAAAELVVKNRLELENHLDQLLIRLGQQMKVRLDLLMSQLTGLEKRLRAPDELIRRQRLLLSQYELRLRQSMREKIQSDRELLAVLAGRLDALSPLAILARGFAIAKEEATGTILKDVTQVRKGDRLLLQLARGKLGATVDSLVVEKKK